MLTYRDIPFSQISEVKELWEKNRKYHENTSKYFGDIYSNIVFEDRIKSFGLFENEHIKITIAEKLSDNEILGYCISIIEGNEGQTQSLHVAEKSRGLGIGKGLMKHHIDWMKNKGCKDIIITVAFENTSTIEFYNKLGFKENTVEMRLK